MALILLGGFRLVGSRVKAKISGQGDSVAALDDRRGSGDGATGVAPAGEGKPRAAAADDGESGKGAAKSAGARGATGAETGISAADKASAGSKVTTTISASEGSAVIANGPPPDAGRSGFNYLGWVPAGVGVLVLAAVLFKGKRSLSAEAGKDKN